MVCEACAALRKAQAMAAPFSSLFIGMVCEALPQRQSTTIDTIFQFPLHRDGV